MATTLPTTTLYRHRLVAAGYDALNAVLWVPTGSDRLRRRFVSSLGLSTGMRVCEFGCGTGLVTRHLCLAGAVVTAVDSAPSMLATARRRAPAAAYVVDDVVDAPVDGPFDRVVLAFVLHELTPDRRVQLLQRSAGLLSGDGSIGILEWARPRGPARQALWTRAVRIIEPPVALDILDDGLERALADAELIIVDDQPLAGGRARAVRASVVPA